MFTGCVVEVEEAAVAQRLGPSDASVNADGFTSSDTEMPGSDVSIFDTGMMTDASLVRDMAEFDASDLAPGTNDAMTPSVSDVAVPDPVDMAMIPGDMMVPVDMALPDGPCRVFQQGNNNYQVFGFQASAVLLAGSNVLHTGGNGSLCTSEVSASALGEALVGGIILYDFTRVAWTFTVRVERTTQVLVFRTSNLEESEIDFEIQINGESIRGAENLSWTFNPGDSEIMVVWTPRAPIARDEFRAMNARMDILRR